MEARLVQDSRSTKLHVQDSGPGIPPESRKRLFQRFARGDSSRARTSGSTGLGLSIVETIVKAHGGKVSLVSKPGKTVVTVSIPL